jgi:hypothetical protein
MSTDPFSYCVISKEEENDAYRSACFRIICHSKEEENDAYRSARVRIICHQ